MELKCPHCNKKLEMSLEEIALSGKHVVCPRCLCDFVAHDVDVSGVLPVAEPASITAPQFCHSCGKSLPASGLSFCPYCGVSLKMPNVAKEAGVQVAQNVATVPHEPAMPLPLPHEPENGIPPIPYMPSYHLMTQPASRRWSLEPASLKFRVLAWLVIAVLSAIFACIVWAGLHLGILL